MSCVKCRLRLSLITIENEEGPRRPRGRPREATDRSTTVPPAPSARACTSSLRSTFGGSTSATRAGRQAVVELLAAFGRPMSISDIASALPEVPRSSAYRHLSDLQRRRRRAPDRGE